jgi:hypothetical protein
MNPPIAPPIASGIPTPAAVFQVKHAETGGENQENERFVHRSLKRHWRCRGNQCVVVKSVRSECGIGGSHLRGESKADRVQSSSENGQDDRVISTRLSGFRLALFSLYSPPMRPPPLSPVPVRFRCLPRREPAARWWKGNLHTHSLWSDGDDFPEMIAAWYKERGYQFLALSDHNVLSDHERWIPIPKGESGALALSKYHERFGDAWVELREEKGKQQVRLKMLM